MTTPNINTILRKDVRNSRFGAPMGDSDTYDMTPKLYLQRVDFVDGCYGPDGTYWGMGAPMWCAFNAPAAQGTRVYVRARTREAAKAEVLAKLTSVSFYR
jgi:hypothetical protein